MKAIRKAKKIISEISHAFAVGRHWREVVLPELADGTPTRYITVAACIKNEAIRLAEWLEFHHRLGVEHFILYDNGSSDDLQSVCKPYIATGLITLIPWQNFSVFLNQQRAAYAHALMNFGALTTWMGFFDIDEFMFPVEAASLNSVLREREHIPVLSVCGINFGTGGHRIRPLADVTRSYRMGVPMSSQREHSVLLNTKSFVRPHRVEAVVSAHWFRIKGDSAIGYTETGRPLFGKPHKQADVLSCDIIRYNHYFTRSLEEFEYKCGGTDVRGTASIWNNTRIRRQGMFNLLETLGQEDRVIERLLMPGCETQPKSSSVLAGT